MEPVDRRDAARLCPGHLTLRDSKSGFGKPLNSNDFQKWHLLGKLSL